MAGHGTKGGVAGLTLTTPIRARFSFPDWIWALNLSLFFLTLVSTTTFGSALVKSFREKRPPSVDAVIDAYSRLRHLDPQVWSGLWFSGPLLLVLLAHELGHYLECRRRGVDASLPYFLPSPFLFGTFGAFIRIRTPIYTRAGLFDIGFGGPLAGFLVLLPFLIAGVWMSSVANASGNPQDAITFGTPLAVRALEWICFPGAPPGQILLHPIALAAWVGLFATAFNLLPMGQLDGGHILYALGGERWHRRVSTAFIGLLVVLGFLYWAWWFWAVIMFFFGRRHPLIYDNTPLSKGRLLLCAAALILFILSACPVPVLTV